MMTGAVMTYWLDNSQTYQCSWLLSWGVFAAKSQVGNCEKQTTERVCARVHLQYINPHIFFSCFFFFPLSSSHTLQTPLYISKYTR